MQAKHISSSCLMHDCHMAIVQSDLVLCYSESRGSAQTSATIFILPMRYQHDVCNSGA